MASFVAMTLLYKPSVSEGIILNVNKKPYQPYSKLCYKAGRVSEIN